MADQPDEPAFERPEPDPDRPDPAGPDPARPDPARPDRVGPDRAGSDRVGPNAARPGEVTATVLVNAPAERVFAAFVAWDRQGEWIPLTRVRVVEGDGGPGSMIEAITTVGKAVLRDEMLVDELDPPYQVRVVHCGPLLRGPGVMRCTPLGGGRTQMVWHEWFQLPMGVAGRVTWPLLWPGSKLSLTYALKRFARLVEAGRLP